MITKDLNARRNGFLVPLTYGRPNFDFIFTKLAPYCNDPTFVISVCKRCGSLIFGRFGNVNITTNLMLAIRFLESNKAFIAKQVLIPYVLLFLLLSWRPLSL
jgi:hypothetical protein